MARSVPSLSAFREALLDSLFDDRDEFRYEHDADEEQMWVKPAMARMVERLEEGEPIPRVLADLMLGDVPRIQRAVAYARDNDPEVLSPDTVTLSRSTVGELRP